MPCSQVFLVRRRKVADVVEPRFGCTLDDAGSGGSLVRVSGELDSHYQRPRLTQMLRQARGERGLSLSIFRGLTRVDAPASTRSPRRVVRLTARPAAGSRSRTLTGRAPTGTHRGLEHR